MPAICLSRPAPRRSSILPATRGRTERLVIQLKLIGRADPADIGTLLPALTEAAARVDVDHTRLAATLEWVQYRKNFRAPVMVRPFRSSPENGTDHDGPLAEIAIDARRAKDMDRAELVAIITDRLEKALGIIPDVHECVHLESWVRPSKSVMWSFNRAYWRHLASWDETFQKDYAAALPGGVSDGTNREFWGAQLEAFMDSLDRLDAWSELPDDIHVLELGVGDGEQALVWLDAFAALCRERGRDYLGRVRYLMADYSPHVLQRAKERVAAYGEQVEAIELDFRNPMHGLEHLQQKVLFAHTCNLYDNLPTDELMRVGDSAYEPLVRASITPDEVKEISAKHGIAQEEIVAHVQHVIRNGPGSLPDPSAGVQFWADVWDSIHLEEIYVEISSPSSLRLAPTAEAYLDTLLDDMPDWTRVHRSTVAVESFAQTLMLLHHEGVLVAQDLFIRELNQYGLYRGPGKLEGSIVNWLNGPIFQIVGDRLGFKVDVEPFAYREGSNTAVLTARHRDTHRVALGTETTTEDAGLAPAAA
jgi:hypothetical protein